MAVTLDDSQIIQHGRQVFCSLISLGRVANRKYIYDVNKMYLFAQLVCLLMSDLVVLF